MSIKNKIFFIVVLLYIIYTTFPLFAYTFHIPVWLPGIVVLLTSLLLYPSFILKNNTFFWFFLYGIVSFLFMFFGRKIKLDIGPSSNYFQLLIEYAFFLPNILIAIVLINLNDMRFFSILYKYIIACLFLSFIIILPQMQQSNLRLMAVALEEGRNAETLSYLGYTLLHAYIIVLPAVLFGCKINKTLSKWLYYVFLLLLLYMIIKSNITTTILISIGVLILALGFGKNKNSTKYYLYLFIVVMAFLFLYLLGGLIQILDWVAPYFEDTAVEEKIYDMRQSLLLSEISGGSLVGRQNYHSISWNSFLSNILLGGGKFGGHSCLLDRLACMGLVGFIPYIMIYVSIIKQWKQYFVNKSAHFYYYLGIGAVDVLLYSKGLFGQEGNLFFMVLLPIMIISIENNNKSSLKSECQEFGQSK